MAERKSPKRGTEVKVSVVPSWMKDHPHRHKLEDYIEKDREKSKRARIIGDIWHNPNASAFAGALAYQERKGVMYRTGVGVAFTPEEAHWLPTSVEVLGKFSKLGAMSGERLIGSLMDHADMIEGGWENFNIVQPINPVERFLGFGEETLKNSIERLQKLGAHVTNRHEPRYIQELESTLKNHQIMILSFGPNVSKAILQNYRDEQDRVREMTDAVARGDVPADFGALEAGWEVEIGVELGLPPSPYLRIRKEARR